MPTVGLDLGKHSFRAVELDRNVVTRFGYYENPNLNIDASAEEATLNYVDALKTFFSEIGFTTPNVVVGLEESSIFMRIIKIPEMGDKDLKNAITYEAEQYVPLPLKEVSLSYQSLGADPLEKGKMRVQIVAAKQKVLQKYVDIIKSARLVPRAIEPETIALGRVLGDSPSSPVGTTILSIGHSNSLIIMVYGGFVRFTRAIPVGGYAISKALQQSLNLDYTQAEEYKKVYGLDRNHFEGKIYDVVKPIVDSIVNEVRRANLFFTKESPDANIKQVVVTGGTALMPGLMFYLVNSLELEVALANPLLGLTVSPKLKEKGKLLIQEAPMYSVALGLAKKGEE